VIGEALTRCKDAAKGDGEASERDNGKGWLQVN